MIIRKYTTMKFFFFRILLLCASGERDNERERERHTHNERDTQWERERLVNWWGNHQCFMILCRLFIWLNMNYKERSTLLWLTKASVIDVHNCENSTWYLDTLYACSCLQEGGGLLKGCTNFRNMKWMESFLRVFDIFLISEQGEFFCSNSTSY